MRIICDLTVDCDPSERRVVWRPGNGHDTPQSLAVVARPRDELGGRPLGGVVQQTQSPLATGRRLTAESQSVGDVGLANEHLDVGRRRPAQSGAAQHAWLVLDVNK